MILKNAFKIRSHQYIERNIDKKPNYFKAGIMLIFVYMVLIPVLLVLIWKHKWMSSVLKTTGSVQNCLLELTGRQEIQIVIKVQPENLMGKKIVWIDWLLLTAEHWPQQPSDTGPLLESCGRNLINIFTAGIGNCLCWENREENKPNYCVRECHESPLFALLSPVLQFKVQGWPRAVQQPLMEKLSTS